MVAVLELTTSVASATLASVRNKVVRCLKPEEVRSISQRRWILEKNLRDKKTEKDRQLAIND